MDDVLTIGLLCPRTFTYEGRRPVLVQLEIAIEDVVEVDIEGCSMSTVSRRRWPIALGPADARDPGLLPVAGGSRA